MLKSSFLENKIRELNDTVIQCATNGDIAGLIDAERERVKTLVERGRQHSVEVANVMAKFYAWSEEYGQSD